MYPQKKQKKAVTCLATAFFISSILVRVPNVETGELQIKPKPHFAKAFYWFI